MDLSLLVLRQKLESHLELKIPVITVVAVIGSTEESAIDPILEMHQMREEFKKRVSAINLYI